MTNKTLEKWEEKPFEKCIENVQYTNKIPKKDFKNTGLYPIISQEDEYINGYWDSEKDLFEIKKPVVIFGDHTKKVKYIDFDFVLGADGVKIISTIDNILPKYMYYYLQNIQLRDLGYARHYKLLKEKFVQYPNKHEQQRIVGILDEAFENIEKAKQNALQNLNNAKELFESYLTSILVNKDNWDKKKLSEVAIDFGRGRSRHRPRNDKKLYGGQYPFIQTGEIRNSNHFITEYSQTYNEIGLAQSKLWPKGTLCITIAANIAETGVLTFDACFPDSVIGCVFDETKTNIDYVEYLLQSFKAILQAEGKGSAQDNINLGTFEKHSFPFPDKTKQDEIVNKLDSMRNNIAKLEQIYEQKIKALDELKQSILQKAFNGEL